MWLTAAVVFMFVVLYLRDVEKLCYMALKLSFSNNGHLQSPTLAKHVADLNVIISNNEKTVLC